MLRNLLPTVMQVLALPALLAGCAPAMETGNAAEPGLLSSLQVTRTGEMVTFDLLVTNTGDETVEFVFPSGQSAEFVVERPNGAEIWRWSEGQMFTQAIRAQTLGPEESWRASGQWSPPAELAGEFVARGWVTARDLRVEQATRFRLP